jgi:hypothetical protein
MVLSVKIILYWTNSLFSFSFVEAVGLLIVCRGTFCMLELGY